MPQKDLLVHHDLLLKYVLGFPGLLQIRSVQLHVLSWDVEEVLVRAHFRAGHMLSWAVRVMWAVVVVRVMMVVNNVL